MTDKKDKSQESEINDEKLEKRRKALKNILAGSGTVVTAAAMQDKWAKPVIESVVLPAHAQTSGLRGSFVSSNQNVQNGTDLLDVLVPTANAVCPFDLCISVDEDGLVTVQVDDCGTISYGSAPSLPFDIYLEFSGSRITGAYDAENDVISGAYENSDYKPAVRSTVECNLGPQSTTSAPSTTGGPTGTTGGPTGTTGGPTGTTNGPGGTGS